MWILATVSLFLGLVVAAASNISSDCKVTQSGGQYSYTADGTPDKNYSDYSWSNETNHPVATNKSSSVSPVMTSSHQMLVSSRNLGNLTLKRYYNMGERVEEETVLCYANALMDYHIAPDDRTGGQPWATVAGVAGGGAVAAAVVFVIWMIRRKNKVPKAEPEFQAVDNPDSPFV